MHTPMSNPPGKILCSAKFHDSKPPPKHSCIIMGHRQFHSASKRQVVIGVHGGKQVHRQPQPVEWITVHSSKLEVSFERQHQHGHRVDQLARNKNAPVI